MTPDVTRATNAGHRSSWAIRYAGLQRQSVYLVEPRSAAYADRVIARAITGKLCGQQIQVVGPEDFVVMKILATRERDPEDADTVMWNVAATLDMDLINRELEFLAGEIADHEIAERWRRTKLDD